MLDFKNKLRLNSEFINDSLVAIGRSTTAKRGGWDLSSRYAECLIPSVLDSDQSAPDLRSDSPILSSSRPSGGLGFRLELLSDMSLESFHFFSAMIEEKWRLRLDRGVGSFVYQKEK